MARAFHSEAVLASSLSRKPSCSFSVVILIRPVNRVGLPEPGDYSTGAWQQRSPRARGGRIRQSCKIQEKLVFDISNTSEPERAFSSRPVEAVRVLFRTRQRQSLVRRRVGRGIDGLRFSLLRNLFRYQLLYYCERYLFEMCFGVRHRNF